MLDRPTTPHRLLGSTAMVHAGAVVLRLVHLASGRPGHGVPGARRLPVHRPPAAVLALTLIFGFAIAAVSYALVESPCREALRRWEKSAKHIEPQDVDREADAIAP
ncbi:putative acyltransferase [Mycobacterium kansasii 662]|uniref:Putative acyltransferase n=1 Tax=Mycobacterium kansasii 662 TaxID=1299326 RepID=X7YHH2_MYCKA|nr:putative acyltransferase [Mycobacterium kansasii 662]